MKYKVKIMMMKMIQINKILEVQLIKKIIKIALSIAIKLLTKFFQIIKVII
jgi:hypothetical protein